jgi:hypothetical protein
LNKLGSRSAPINHHPVSIGSAPTAPAPALFVLVRSFGRRGARRGKDGRSLECERIGWVADTLFGQFLFHSPGVLVSSAAGCGAGAFSAWACMHHAWKGPGAFWCGAGVCLLGFLVALD